MLPADLERRGIADPKHPPDFPWDYRSNHFPYRHWFEDERGGELPCQCLVIAEHAWQRVGMVPGHVACRLQRSPHRWHALGISWRPRREAAAPRSTWFRPTDGGLSPIHADDQTDRHGGKPAGNPGRQRPEPQSIDTVVPKRPCSLRARAWALSAGMKRSF